jgi:TetR/AcrR family transcriptional regulator, transcriptional repressor for nem operon
MVAVRTKSNTKARLLEAAVYTIRAKGYSGTTVDDLCHAAGVTKGGFFHYFTSKEEIAVAAADQFSLMADHLFTTAPYTNLVDPVERLLAYLDYRKAILLGELPEYTCLLGTMVQESYQTHPVIRDACEKHLDLHVAMLERDILEAMASRGIRGEWTAESLGVYMQAVIQGAFIFAKAKGGPDAAADCLDHLRRYLEFLFTSKPTETKPNS